MSLDDSRKLKLMYFDGPGKGEAIRLICAYAGLSLVDHRFKDRAEFTAMVRQHVMLLIHSAAAGALANWRL